MPVIKNIEAYLNQLETLPPFEKKLKDIPNEDYELKMIDVSDTLDWEDNSIQIIGSLKIGPQLFVFNDPDDNKRDDADGVSDIVSETDLESEVLIVPDYKKQAVVNYSLDAFLKAGISLDKIGFSFSGKARLKINTYKIHDRDESLLKAASSDLQNFAWIFSLSELKNLKENEVCTLSFAGELSSSLEISWSDLYTGSLLGISSLLKVASPLAVEIDAGASVEFELGIKDDFLLVIKKIAESKYEIGVKKNKKRSIAAGASIGVSASLAKGSLDTIDKVIDDLLEQILKKGKDEINSLLDKTNIDELAKDQLEVIELVAKVLNIPSPEGKLAEIKLKWADFLVNMKKGIEIYVKAKVEAGVRFEYGQIKTEKSLLIAEFTEKALDKYHQDLIKFNIKHLLKDDSGALVIKKFLHERGYKRTTGFGFGLKIAEKGLSLDRETSIELIERTNEKGFLHVESNSLKSYEGELFGESFGWTAGLQAETDGFVNNPKMDDFNCSLHLGFEWTENRKLERNEIKKVADLAVVWNLVPQYKMDDIKNLLSAKLKTKEAKDIVISVKSHIPQDLFKDIIKSIYKLQQNNINAYYSLLAKALAASMFASNETVAERIEKHGNYFLMYLKGENRDHPTIREYSAYINDSHLSQLAKSISVLVNKGDENYSSDSLKSVIKGFNKFHNNIYRVKVLGYLMQNFAQIIGRSNEIESVFQITYKKGEKHTVMNIIKQLAISV